MLGYDKENKIVFPFYISQKSNKLTFNVLLITKEDKSHYVFIKGINKLLSSQLRTKNKGKKHICLACLENFIIEDVLIKHKKSMLRN